MSEVNTNPQEEQKIEVASEAKEAIAQIAKEAAAETKNEIATQVASILASEKVEAEKKAAEEAGYQKAMSELKAKQEKEEFEKIEALRQSKIISGEVAKENTFASKIKESGHLMKKKFDEIKEVVLEGNKYDVKTIFSNRANPEFYFTNGDGVNWKNLTPFFTAKNTEELSGVQFQSEDLAPITTANYHTTFEGKKSFLYSEEGAGIPNNPMYEALPHISVSPSWDEEFIIESHPNFYEFDAASSMSGSSELNQLHTSGDILKSSSNSFKLGTTEYSTTLSKRQHSMIFETKERPNTIPYLMDSSQKVHNFEKRLEFMRGSFRGETEGANNVNFIGSANVLEVDLNIAGNEVADISLRLFNEISSQKNSDFYSESGNKMLVLAEPMTALLSTEKNMLALDANVKDIYANSVNPVMPFLSPYERAFNWKTASINSIYTDVDFYDRYQELVDAGNNSGKRALLEEYSNYGMKNLTNANPFSRFFSDYTEKTIESGQIIGFILEPQSFTVLDGRDTTTLCIETNKGDDQWANYKRVQKHGIVPGRLKAYNRCWVIKQI